MTSTQVQEYRGRFAPSPTGPLHFGSLIAALGSFLDAKHHQGAWLVRIEDLDTPRCIPGAADAILRTLEEYGLHWDESVMFQSNRNSAYEDALIQLTSKAAAYPCACTRKEISDSALTGMGIDGPVYPGTCRNGIPAGKTARAWRANTDLPGTQTQRIEFEDLVLGKQSQDLEKESGDFILKRADGLFAYQLAVVVDDASQGITHVVRGADLLASTPRQIYLQQQLGFPTLLYLHLPVAKNPAGEKLSKQTLAPAIDVSRSPLLLMEALVFLGQTPPKDLATYPNEDILNWAITNWDREAITNQLATGN